MIKIEIENVALLLLNTLIASQCHQSNVDQLFFKCSMLHFFELHLRGLATPTMTSHTITQLNFWQAKAVEERPRPLTPLKVIVKIFKCARKDNKSTPIIDIFCGLSFRPRHK